VQRLQTRPQFQAVLNGVTIAKTEHFVLHRKNIFSSEVGGQALSDVGSKEVSPKLVGEDLQRQPLSLFPVQDVWFGAMVPKRWAKRAVTRNAIKRQIYTVTAEFQACYPHAAFVVRLRREFSRKQFVSAASSALKDAVRCEVVLLLQAGLDQP